MSVAEVSRFNDRWAVTAVNSELRKQTLALELARLDKLQLVFHQRALAGDVQCGALVSKLIERRCAMLGLYAPQTAVLKIVDEATPKETSTDRIERSQRLDRRSKERSDYSQIAAGNAFFRC
jgi:hypothetical protein